MMKQWIVSGGCPIESTPKKLEIGHVYTMTLDPMTEGLILREEETISLEEIRKKYIISSIQDRLINDVYDVWKSIQMPNYGLIFHGEVGTGKSVTSRLLLSKFSSDCPIIRIRENYGARLIDFVRKNPIDTVYFIDEVEKTFNEDGDKTDLSNMLSGDVPNMAKSIFVMTSNKKYLGPTFTNRSERVWFNIEIKPDLEFIDKMIEAEGLSPERAEVARKEISKVSGLNVDLIKSIIKMVKGGFEKMLTYMDYSRELLKRQMINITAFIKDSSVVYPYTHKDGKRNQLTMAEILQEILDRATVDPDKGKLMSASRITDIVEDYESDRPYTSIGCSTSYFETVDESLEVGSIDVSSSNLEVITKIEESPLFQVGVKPLKIYTVVSQKTGEVYYYYCPEEQ